MKQINNTITYNIGSKLYINLTNKCTNACEFCVRNMHEGVAGFDLWLNDEPDAADVIDAMGDVTKWDEVVYCGYGEPTMRLDVLLETARYIKDSGVNIRLNTNGQANMQYGEDITPKLDGLIDTISISLNAPDADKYQQICHSDFGVQSYEGLIEFARLCTTHIPNIILTVVDLLSADEINKCRKIAEEIGAKLRVRSYIE